LNDGFDLTPAFVTSNQLEPGNDALKVIQNMICLIFGLEKHKAASAFSQTPLGELTELTHTF